jgi:hypothetical protein
MLKKLSFDDYLPLEELYEWGYIPEFKIYGPCKKFMVKIGDLINALNRRVQLKIPDEYIEPLYILIKEYNTIASNKEGASLATVAEHELELILFKKEKEFEEKAQIENPLADNTTETEMNNIERVIVSQPFVIRKKKRVKPKLYELIASQHVTDSDMVKSKSEREMFNNIEFEL